MRGSSEAGARFNRRLLAVTAVVAATMVSSGLLGITNPAGAASAGGSGEFAGTAKIEANLNSVSCWSAKACIAVGDYLNSKDDQLPIAMAWNGTTWTMQKISGQGTIGSYLFATSCSSASYCMAVGQSEVPYSPLPLPTLFAEAWDGKVWKILPGLQPPKTDEGYLWDVSCVATNSCTVVGDAGELPATKPGVPLVQGVAERWDGTKWTNETVPFPKEPSNSTILDAVSCRTASECTAVGTYGTDTMSVYHSYPVAENWNGSEWTFTKLPMPPAGTTIAVTYLNALSCAAAGQCVTTGTYTADTHAQDAFSIVQGSKGWTDYPVAAPKPVNAISPNILSTSCVTASWCMGTGTYQSLSNYHALAEVWNGKSWTLSAVGDSAQPATTLSWASCTATSSCMTVGTSGSTPPTLTPSYTLAESLSGAKWSIVPTPQPPGCQSACSPTARFSNLLRPSGGRPRR